MISAVIACVLDSLARIPSPCYERSPRVSAAAGEDTLFQDLFAIIAPVFLIVALGFGWGRSAWRFEAEFVSRLVTKIATPALVFSTLVGMGVGLDAFGEMVLAA